MIEIARAIEKLRATVFSFLRYHGGMRPRHRARAAKSLSLDEREEISRGLVRVFDLSPTFWIEAPLRSAGR